VGGVFELFKEAGTQPLPFQTLNTGGVTEVSYHVDPMVGLPGGVPPEAEGKVWLEAKITAPPKVVVPSGFNVPLMILDDTFLRLVT
jgi:hypothetical protein